MMGVATMRAVFPILLKVVPVLVRNIWRFLLSTGHPQVRFAPRECNKPRGLIETLPELNP
jgi:hypothetical protein